MVEHILKNTDLKLSDMDAIAVAVGRLLYRHSDRRSRRQGAGLFRGQARRGGIHAGGLARNVAFADGLVVCAMDCRRQQVYNANFAAENGTLTRLTPDRAVSLADLAEELPNESRPVTLAGDGAHLVFDYFAEHGIPCRLAPPHLIMENAMSVALEAEELARQAS